MGADRSPSLNRKLLNEIISSSARYPVYPQETVEPWLSSLLDIYHLVDNWSIKTMESIGVQHQIICAKGCSNCCKLLTVPINYLEFKGLSWYVDEVLQDENRVNIKARLLAHNDAGCPFLIDNVCAVYPLRPIACRQFFVLNRPCSPGENPWLKRKEDVFCSLDSEISWLIATKVLPFFGIHEESEQRKAFEKGYLAEEDRPLHLFNWSSLSKRIK